MNGELRSSLLIAYRDLVRFWKFKHWLASQIVMNLADVVIFALIFNNIVNREYIPDYIKFMSTGVLSVSVFASSFSIGREVGAEMRREVVYYLLTLPASRWALIAGRIMGGTFRGLIYQLAFIALNIALVGVPNLYQAAIIAYTSVVLSASMSALAIAISTSTRDFNLQATFRALTYYTLFFLSNVFYPREVLRLRFPGPLADAIAHTPVSLASDVYRWAFGYYSSINPLAIFELTLWAILLLVLAALLYRRNISR
ncbi:MAG: ABC transporter permease [Thermofilaceae archaeon]